jgi:hypothetical protein
MESLSVFFEKEYYLPWRDLSSLLGFNKRCSLDLNSSLKHFNHHNFWGQILGQAIVGKFQPRNMENSKSYFEAYASWGSYDFVSYR